MMTRFLCLTLCLVFVGASPAAKYDSDRFRIMNGELATEGQFPFAVSLQQETEDGNHDHICSISLITTTTCLGAAHCLFDKSKLIEAKMLCGIVGSVHQGPELDCHDYVSVLPHEDYDAENILNDIALFIFNDEIEIGDKVQIMQLAGPAKEVDGKQVTALGWGKTKSAGESSEQLRYTSLRVTEKSVCDELYGDDVRDDQICLSGDNAGTCEGDSGGPVVLADSNVGIALVSYGVTDCDIKPSINTDVRKFIEWIEEHAEGEPVVVD